MIVAQFQAIDKRNLKERSPVLISFSLVLTIQTIRQKLQNLLRYNTSIQYPFTTNLNIEQSYKLLKCISLKKKNLEYFSKGKIFYLKRIFLSRVTLIFGLRCCWPIIGTSTTKQYPSTHLIFNALLTFAIVFSFFFSLSFRLILML